jgi:mono/diheme cytochrome c family protein
LGIDLNQFKAIVNSDDRRSMVWRWNMTVKALCRGLVCAVSLSVLLLPEVRAGENKTRSVEDQVKIGAVDYENFCAACHGKDARGNGPVAMELKTTPPSLRQLAARRNGVFDVNEIVKIIDGRDMPRAHGTPEMPIWGSLFRYVAEASGILSSNMEDSEKDAQKHILGVAKYLETIQEK